MAIAQPASQWEYAVRVRDRFPTCWDAPVPAAAPPTAALRSSFPLRSPAAPHCTRTTTMQHALIALPGDGILGLCQIKCHRAIFHHDGVSRADEKVFDCSDQSFRVHITIIAGEYLFVCDE